jgi:hypothetical protein
VTDGRTVWEINGVSDEWVEDIHDRYKLGKNSMNSFYFVSQGREKIKWCNEGEQYIEVTMFMLLIIFVCHGISVICVGVSR